MKQLWFMITTLCFIVVTLFATTACNKTEKSDEVESNVVTKIEAKVENASKYSNVVEVKLMMYDLSVNNYIELASGDWEGDGFTIVLPKTIDPNYLHTLINNKEYLTIIDPPSTVIISNKNVKVLHARFFGVDKDGNIVTRFYPIGIDEAGYGQDAYYTYVDSDVIIFGYTERMNTTLAQTEYDKAKYEGITLILNMWDKITTDYSINWKKGWSLWSFSRFGDIPENTATEKWAPIPVSRLKWFSTEDIWAGNEENNF